MLKLIIVLRKIKNKEYVIGSFQRELSWFGTDITDALETMIRENTFGSIQIFRVEQGKYDPKDYPFGYFQEKFTGDHSENYRRMELPSIDYFPWQIIDAQQRLQTFYILFMSDSKFYIHHYRNGLFIPYFNLDRNWFTEVKNKRSFEVIECDKVSDNQHIFYNKNDEALVSFDVIRECVMREINGQASRYHDLFKNDELDDSYGIRENSLVQCISSLRRYLESDDKISVQEEYHKTYDDVVESFIMKNSKDNTVSEMDRFFAKASKIRRDFKYVWIDDYEKYVTNIYDYKEALTASLSVLFERKVTDSFFGKLSTDDIGKYIENYESIFATINKFERQLKDNYKSLYTPFMEYPKFFMAPVITWMHKYDKDLSVECVGFLAHAMILHYPKNYEKTTQNLKGVYECIRESQQLFPKDDALRSNLKDTKYITLEERFINDERRLGSSMNYYIKLVVSLFEDLNREIITDFNPKEHFPGNRSIYNYYYKNSFDDEDFETIVEKKKSILADKFDSLAISHRGFR